MVKGESNHYLQFEDLVNPAALASFSVQSHTSPLSIRLLKVAQDCSFLFDQAHHYSLQFGDSL